MCANLASSSTAISMARIWCRAASSRPQPIPVIPSTTHRSPVREISRIIVYCATSGRSAMAAAVLQMMGYKRVLNLAGGFARWEAECKPQVREAEY